MKWKSVRRCLSFVYLFITVVVPVSCAWCPVSFFLFFILLYFYLFAWSRLHYVKLLSGHHSIISKYLLIHILRLTLILNKLHNFINISLLLIRSLEKAVIKPPHSATRGPFVMCMYPLFTICTVLIDHHLGRVILHRNLECFHYTEGPFEKIAFVFTSSATTAVALHCWHAGYLCNC